MNIHMQRQTTGMPYLFKSKFVVSLLAYNNLHDPEWVKNASRRATPSLSIGKYEIN